MEKTNNNTGSSLKVLALILCISAMPLVCATGCFTSSRYQQSTGEYTDDSGLSASVKKALNDDQVYKYDGVNVVTFKGVVQLSGFVVSRDQMNRAGELAKKVGGVNELQNNITVKE
ncbi:MAG: BON domain-containing protein [Verrucomicrobiota bacterium]